MPNKTSLVLTAQHQIFTYKISIVFLFSTFSNLDTAIEPVPVLHDPTIEETEPTPDNKNDTEKNEVEPPIESIPLDATDRFYQSRKNSMAIYYGWQIVCLLIFIFTAYETLQNV